MKPWIARAGIAALLSLHCGCYPANREIRTLSSLRDAAPVPLRLMAKDGAVYELATYTVTDSTIEGSGMRLDGKRVPFTGSFRFQELVYVQKRQGGLWNTLGVVSSVALTCAWFSLAAQDHGLRVFSIGEGSCPYIYAWDGGKYALQGEAFGTSFGRALESCTCCMLPEAVLRDGAVNLRLTNERPETHYVNSTALLAFEVPARAQVVLDVGNQAWPVFDPQPPLHAPPALRAHDGVRWTFAPTPTGQGVDYHASLDLVYARPQGAVEGSLIVHALNTDLAYAAFELVSASLGDESLRFLYQVEHDPQLIQMLHQWVAECSLVVEVQDGDVWRTAGVVAPEASAIPFTRLVRVTAGAATGDAMRVRLRGLAGLWSLDAVEVDWTESAAIEARRLELRTASHSGGMDETSALRRTDDHLAVMLPGERLDLSFAAWHASEHGDVAYALEVGGYLHEWPPVSQPQGEPVLIPAVAGVDPLALVNFVIRHRDVLLPHIYRYWSQRRERS